MKLILLLLPFLISSLQAALLTQAEKDLILSTHNNLREQIANGFAGFPAADNMRVLIWDQNLEKRASALADMGLFAHNPDDFDEDTNSYVGENLYSIRSSGTPVLKVDTAIQKWFDEYIYFDSAQIADFENNGANGQMVGHFTQVVWGSTNKLGCGKYVTSGRINLVCNYGEAGNFIGEPVYTSGIPCSKCTCVTGRKLCN